MDTVLLVLVVISLLAAGASLFLHFRSGSTTSVSNQQVKKFPLADALDQLADNLRTAVQHAANDQEPDIIKLKDCSVELAVTWEYEADGKIKWSVIEVGAGVTKTDAHTITVNLEPLDTTHPVVLGVLPNGLFEQAIADNIERNMKQRSELREGNSPP